MKRNRKEPLSEAQRRFYVELGDTLRALGQGPTLDGHRAVVSGCRNDFATVHDLETGNSVEFAWETVAHIFTKRDGKFKS